MNGMRPVILVLLLLLVFNEGIRLSRRIRKKPKVPRSCPRNSKLQSLRKILGLATTGRTKRLVLDFPINCLHVGMVEFDDGVQFLNPLYQCCHDCHFPDYLSCIWGGNPDWLCASRAYKCICDCRETHLASESADSVSLKVFSSNVKSGKKSFKSTTFCKKKICSRFAGDDCCVENRCIRLYVHKRKSPIRQ